MARAMVGSSPACSVTSRRPVLCADRRDVPGLRHFRRESRRHGGVAPVLFPEMSKRGAKPGDWSRCLSATGAQTETIPPSARADHDRFGDRRLDRGAVHRRPAAGAGARASRSASWSGRATATRTSHVVRRAPGARSAGLFLIALPAIALPFVIRAAVVEGVATATEVSTIGIAYSVARRPPDLSAVRLAAALADAGGDGVAHRARSCFIIGCATAMAWALTQSGFSRNLADAMAAMPGGSRGFLAVTIVAFVMLGSVLEGIPAIVLFGPLLFPIAKQVGVHEVHYAMVVILAMGIGLFAPPFGVGYYAACAISQIDPDEGLRYIWAYVLALLAGLIVVAAIPWISIGFLELNNDCLRKGYLMSRFFGEIRQARICRA